MPKTIVKGLNSISEVNVDLDNHQRRTSAIHSVHPKLRGEPMCNDIQNLECDESPMRIVCAKQVSMTSYYYSMHLNLPTADDAKRRNSEKDQAEPSVT